MAAGKEIDNVTGVETTGHVWDGDLKELNQPLPKWWLYTFYVSIIWAIGYWVVYPAWPTLDGYTKGLWNYSQRQVVADDIKQARQVQARFVDEIRATPLGDIRSKPELFEFARTGGAAVFGDNCAACHGRGAQGGAGYPNLNDDDWLWGGNAADIQKTIEVGIRSGAKDARDSAMPRYGLDGIMESAQISDIAEYVLSLSGRSTDAAAAQRGKQTFAEQCVACHQEAGQGNPELGAPNLTDGIWLYGSSKADIEQSIRTGRGGVMPSWAGRLDPATIKMLTVYVHSLGGGK